MSREKVNDVWIAPDGRALHVLAVEKIRGRVNLLLSDGSLMKLVDMRLRDYRKVGPRPPDTYYSRGKSVVPTKTRKPRGLSALPNQTNVQDRQPQRDQDQQ